MPITPTEVMLAQAQSQLARQEAKLTAFRSVAGTVIAARGVIAGLVAGRLVGPSISVAGVIFASLAAIAFLASTILAIQVLAPTDGYKFSENLDSYQAWLDAHGSEDGADVSFMLGLAKNLDADRKSNEVPLKSVANRLVYCCVSLGIQVAFWVIAALVA